MVSLMNRPTLIEEAMSLREAIDDLFRNSFLFPTWRTVFGQTVAPSVALDVYEDNDNYYVIGVLPGIEPEQVDVTCEGNTLTISGEIPSFIPEGKQVVWQELPSGSFRRTLTLPAPFEVGKVEAHYDAGVLKLVVPKAENARARKIQVRAAQPQLTSGG